MMYNFKLKKTSVSWKKGSDLLFKFAKLCIFKIKTLKEIEYRLNLLWEMKVDANVCKAIFK